MDNPNCVKCKKPKEPDQFKCCEVCRQKGRDYHHQNRDIKNQKSRDYHYQNRDKNNQRRREHHQINKESEKVRRQKYEAENRPKINARRRERHNQIKDTEEFKEAKQKKQSIIHFCPVCKYQVKLYKKSQHEKSLTHQNNLKQMNQEPEPEETP